MHVRRCSLLAGLFLALAASLPASGVAQRVDVRIVLPPPERFAAPPPVIVIPGTYVYVIPDVHMDIFFFSGYWYRPYRDHWFRARSYNGPWSHRPDNSVPRALMQLPPGYRDVPPGYRRIPQGQLRRNWAIWERGHHWDRDPQWREGRRGRPGGRQMQGPERLEGRPGKERGDRDTGGERAHGRDFGPDGRENGRDPGRGGHGRGR